MSLFETYHHPMTRFRPNLAQRHYLTTKTILHKKISIFLKSKMATSKYDIFRPTDAFRVLAITLSSKLLNSE